MKEVVAGKVADFNNGQMKKIDVGEESVLLVKENDQFFAVGNKCSHYGAPLSNGAYCEGVVRCPWHGACFNVKNGDIEDYPGLDSLHKFEVKVCGDDVIIKIDLELLKSFRRTKTMIKKSSGKSRTVLIIGGGPASVVCAETLRQEGFAGSIVLLSQETHLPYDRIKLSKAMHMNPKEIALRSEEFYKSSDIELMLGEKVNGVCANDKSITLASGRRLNYDKLVLATGGMPRRLPIPGCDLTNVHMLRTPKDANAIISSAEGKNVVIIGSSFIGMEVASSLAAKAKSVSVVDLVLYPFQMTLGEKLGGFMQKLHESNGVKFHFETSVKEFIGENGQVKEAVLANGTVLPADVCVMGVGVVPATEFVKNSGLSMTQRGFITVNKKMETNLPDIYAAGDIVEFPLSIAANQQSNVQHWQMAHMHGRIAGLNIAGKPTDINSVPYFWTVQFGKSVRYTGYGVGYDDVIVHGNVDNGKFLAYYTKGENVIAAASLGWDPIVSQVAQLFNKGGSISKMEIITEASSWTCRL